MNFSNLKEWETPRGNVVELAIDGRVAWKKVVGVPISTLDVGSSVFMNVNGVRTEFLVVHQGLPSSSYDTSCDGTWLLMKDIYESRAFDSLDNDYENSDIHSYLNNTFVNLFDSDIKSVIKQVKIPYRKGAGTSNTVTSGSSGLSAKVFLLSCTEVGFSQSSFFPVEGAVLSYFNGATKSQRVAKLNGSSFSWLFRTPYARYSNSVWFVYPDGQLGADQKVTVSCGVRPALILPSDALVDGNFNVIA